MKELTRDTYLGVLADAGMVDGRDIDFCWFGSCAMGTLWEQDIIRGHVCMSPLVEEGLFPERVPLINVEGACATASMAFHTAWKDILSGQCDVSLAMGVDKFYHPDVEKVLADYEVSYPLTRSMCAPVGDGGAAAILCSEEYFQGLPPEIKSRAVKVSASAITSGKHRHPSEPSLSKFAADRAYKIAGISAKDIGVAEVHDACSFCEIFQAEMMGFCPPG
ncbi:MAG: thiolase family protein, partial [Deltaproteobacteria bacterium]